LPAKSETSGRYRGPEEEVGRPTTPVCHEGWVEYALGPPLPAIVETRPPVLAAEVLQNPEEPYPLAYPFNERTSWLAQVLFQGISGT
jgi:hypothetical protein